MLRAGVKAVEFATDSLDNLGVQSYWDWSMGVADPIRNIRDTYQTWVEGTWNQDPNTYAMTGMSIGQAAGSIGAGASVIGMSIGGKWNRHWKNKGFNEAFNYSGNIYKEVSGDIFGPSGEKIVSETLLKNIKKNGTKGFISEAGTWRNAAKLGKFGWGMAASIAVGIAASYTLGAAGSILDKAAQFDMNRRKMHYDNRYYNTQMYEQGAYQTIGQAMNNYESRLVSLGRIYHSRG